MVKVDLTAWASVGNGSSSHLNMELLKSVAGFDAVHVPFNGSPPAVTSTIQGETQAMFAVMQPLQAQIQAGKLRALAVTTAKRFPLLPDLPTIAESGYPGFEALAWNGVMVPAATPKPIIARLNAEMNAILKQPDVVEKIRGKKGTVVKLLVIPSDATDPSKRNIIEIRRDEVKLKDSEAKAEVLDLQNGNNRPTRIGWITLPSFYANMDGRGP